MRIATTASVLFAALACASAQALTTAPAFLVKAHEPEFSTDFGSAINDNGEGLVVWSNFYSDHDVYAQRMGSDGSLRGSAFRVNTTVPIWSATNPAAGVAPNGDFVVAWSSWEANGGDQSGSHVRAQCYRADGSKKGLEQLLDQDIAYKDPGPSIVMNPDGSFAITWAERPDFGAPPTSVQAERIQRFDRSCAPVGPLVRLTPPYATNLIQGTPGVDANGNSVAIWWDLGNIFYQRYDALGNPLSGAGVANVLASPFIDDAELFPVMGADGDFVILWSVESEIFFRRFDRSGAPIDLIESRISEDVVLAGTAAAIDDDGDFVFAWIATTDAGGCDDFVTGACAQLTGDSIIGQRYAASSLPAPVERGAPFPVADGLVKGGTTPKISMSPSGNMLAAWSAPDTPDQFGPLDLYARRYMLTQQNVRVSATTSGAHYDATPVAGGAAGTYSFVARFCNKGDAVLSGLSSRTASITGGNTLANRTADGVQAPGGVGSSFDFPKSGAYADGLLAPQECVDVPYKIGLAARVPFSFSVNIYGDHGNEPTSLTSTLFTPAPAIPLPGPTTVP